MAFTLSSFASVLFKTIYDEKYAEKLYNQEDREMKRQIYPLPNEPLNAVLQLLHLDQIVRIPTTYLRKRNIFLGWDMIALGKN